MSKPVVKSLTLTGLPLLLLLIIPLIVRLFFYYDSRPVYKVGDSFVSTYSLYHEPKQNDYSQYFFIDDIFVSLPLYPKYGYGDTLKIAGILSETKTENGSLLTIKNPEISLLPNPNPLISITKFVRGRIEETVVTTIPEREAGLLLGVILGVRDKIDSKFYEDLRTAGVLHVVAASGQNVSILAGLALISLQKIVKRKTSILFTGLIVLFYSMLSGFDPPIVRASIMALISFGALIVGRQAIGVGALLLTGWGMVLFDPGLLEDISFQLSFLATSGILLIKPYLDRLRFLSRASFLKDDITTTFSAQIATFPLLLGVFGTYSLISMPANIAILWTVPLLMMLGGSGALMALIHPVLGVPFVILSYPFLYFFSTVVEVFARFPAILHVETLPQAIIFGYYLIMFGIVLGVRSHEGRKL